MFVDAAVAVVPVFVVFFVIFSLVIFADACSYPFVNVSKDVHPLEPGFALPVEDQPLLVLVVWGL